MEAYGLTIGVGGIRTQSFESKPPCRTIATVSIGISQRLEPQPPCHNIAIVSIQYNRYSIEYHRDWNPSPFSYYCYCVYKYIPQPTYLGLGGIRTPCSPSHTIAILCLGISPSTTWIPCPAGRKTTSRDPESETIPR